MYYDIASNKIVGTRNVTLPAGENDIITFVWSASGVCCRNCTLTPVATIAAEDYSPEAGGPMRVV